MTLTSHRSHPRTGEVGLGSELRNQKTTATSQHPRRLRRRPLPLGPAPRVVKDAQGNDEIEAPVPELAQRIHPPEPHPRLGRALPEYLRYSPARLDDHGGRAVARVDVEPGPGEKNRIATSGAADVEDADTSRVDVLVEQSEEALVGSTSREALDYLGVFPEVAWTTLSIGHGHSCASRYFQSHAEKIAYSDSNPLSPTRPTPTMRLITLELERLPHLALVMLLLLLPLVPATPLAAQDSARAVPPPAAQNPSPMVEHTRRHERITPRDLAGVKRTFTGPLDKPVEVFIPEGTKHARALSLVIYFHGSPFVPEYAVSKLGHDHIVAVVSLAPGSGVYDRAFSDPAAFDSLLAHIGREAGAAMHASNVAFRSVTLVGFSAGYGAVRAILRDPRHFAQVDAVLLLDGLHTSYVPDGTALATGGKLDEKPLEIFVAYARAAMSGEKRFLITHSEIFPGTFASTTETTDYMIEKLGLHLEPVLNWGPHGMQQLSEARSGRFAILGFAGNSAPDHIDHAQGMPAFLGMLVEM